MVRSWVMLSLASAATTCGAFLTVLWLARTRLQHEYVFVELPKSAIDALGKTQWISITDIILVAFGAAAVLGCLIAVVAGVFYSHRIAGPLLRIRRTIGDYLDGRAVQPIVLRENDELKELADDLNRVFKAGKS